jgi:hypothetical protein
LAVWVRHGSGRITAPDGFAVIDLRNSQELWTACPDSSRGDLHLGLVGPLDKHSFLERGTRPD